MSFDADERLQRIDEDVGSLVRQVMREMEQKGDWRTPLIEAAIEDEGYEYGVARRRVTDNWLDAYRFFRDKGIDDRDARIYYATATTANIYTPDSEDITSQIYG